MTRADLRAAIDAAADRLMSDPETAWRVSPLHVRDAVLTRLPAVESHALRHVAQGLAVKAVKARRVPPAGYVAAP